MRQYSASRTTAFTAFIIFTTTLLGGCVSPGGYGYSSDKFCYVADEWSPKSVTLMDTRTRQILWSSEVPVGQQLVVKFFEGSDPSMTMPDIMNYGFSKAGNVGVTWQSSIPVPGADSRRIDFALRTVPEFGAGMNVPVPAPVAAPATATPKKDQPKPEMIDLPETVREVK